MYQRIPIVLFLLMLAAVSASAGSRGVHMSLSDAVAEVIAGADSISSESWLLNEVEQAELADRLGGDDGAPEYEIYSGFLDGVLVGRAVILVRPGFHGPIRLAVGIDPTGNVAAVRIVADVEVRGRHISRSRFLKQFLGATSDRPPRIGSDIDAITGATGSSLAVVEGVAEALHSIDLRFGSEQGE